MVTGRHRGRARFGGSRRHGRHRHRPDHQRARRRGAQRHVHPRLRTRRLPPAGPASQLLATHPRTALDRIDSADANQRRRLPARGDHRLRGGSAGRLHVARRPDARPRMAFRPRLRHAQRRNGFRQASGPDPGTTGGRARPRGHAVGGPDGRAVRGHEQADAPRPGCPQRLLRRRARRGRIYRHQAGLRARVRRIPQRLRRGPRPRCLPPDRSTRRALGNGAHHGQVLCRDGRTARRHRMCAPHPLFACPRGHLAGGHHRR